MIIIKMMMITTMTMVLMLKIIFFNHQKESKILIELFCNSMTKLNNHHGLIISFFSGILPVIISFNKEKKIANVHRMKIHTHTHTMNVRNDCFISFSFIRIPILNSFRQVPLYTRSVRLLVSSIR